MIFEFIVGSQATPADNALEWLLQRFTANGTAGTTPTPVALDPGDPGATATTGAQYSAEPTYTATGKLVDFALNQRSTQRWVASPRGELILPANATNGVGIQPIHTSFTGNSSSTIFYRE
jgi:hypothetical protein